MKQISYSAKLMHKFLPRCAPATSAGAILLAFATAFTGPASAEVPAAEAAQLKSTLTPLGGEKAGNKDGSIPAWTGGYTTPVPGFVNGGRRPDPFATDKPLYSVSARNLDQYAAHLTEGQIALLKKYPDSYRLDVYATRRTAAAPAWVYDNTFKNATRAKLAEGPAGPYPQGAYGGVPFPIPKSGAEIMWNHILRWRGTSFHFDFHGTLITADGKQVTTVDGLADSQIPYYFEDGTPESFQKAGGYYFQLRLINAGPPIRAGEAITGYRSIDENDLPTWVYLTGQRRVRKLPNACCDTPTPATAGLNAFDEIDMWTGRIDRYDWKIIGKQEMLVPYNTNRFFTAKKDADVLDLHHLKPEAMRWELHRVWVVEGNLAPGKRHQAPRARFYVDEDTWNIVLSDRWDAKGQLWKTSWALPFAMPDIPATVSPQAFGFNDLLSGAWYMNGLYNEKAEQYKIMPRYPDTTFSPDGLTGEGAR